jgi:hypothetical protein
MFDSFSVAPDADNGDLFAMAMPPAFYSLKRTGTPTAAETARAFRSVRHRRLLSESGVPKPATSF